MVAIVMGAISLYERAEAAAGRSKGYLKLYWKYKIDQLF